MDFLVQYWGKDVVKVEKFSEQKYCEAHGYNKDEDWSLGEGEKIISFREMEYPYLVTSEELKAKIDEKYKKLKGDAYELYRDLIARAGQTIDGGTFYAEDMIYFQLFGGIINEMVIATLNPYNINKYEEFVKKVKNFKVPEDKFLNEPTIITECHKIWWRENGDDYICGEIKAITNGFVVREPSDKLIKRFATVAALLELGIKPFKINYQTVEDYINKKISYEVFISELNPF
jgi:hypothetical protein